MPRMTADSPEFRLLYPFESHFFDVDGGRMHYLDEGGGEPVVMVHGNPTWSFFYRDVVRDFRRDYRCIVPDHIGMGFSDKPQDWEYLLDLHISNLEKLLEGTLPPADAPGGKVNIIMHDWGGPIAMGYAVRHPERVKRVVAMNTSVFSAGTMPERIKLCRVPGLGPMLVRGANAFAKLATRMTTVKPLPLDVRKAFVMPYDSWEHRVAVQRFVEDIPLTRNTNTYKRFVNTEKKLPGVLEGRPLLIQWGMRDWCFTPFFLELWKKAFPSAEVDEYADAGHYLLEDKGETIRRRIREFFERPVQ